MSFKIIGGDLKNDFIFGSTFGTCLLTRGIIHTETINLKQELMSVEQVTEENKKSFVGKAGWGLVGGFALGPIGLLAGALAGGNKKEVCFACTLKDGRKFIATSDAKTYQKIVAASINSNSKSILIDDTKQVSQTSSKFCTNCGQSINDTWKFCPNCAHSIERTEV